MYKLKDCAQCLRTIKCYCVNKKKKEAPVNSPEHVTILVKQKTTTNKQALVNFLNIAAVNKNHVHSLYTNKLYKVSAGMDKILLKYAISQVWQLFSCCCSLEMCYTLIVH